MSGFDFRAFSRIPEVNPTRYPFRIQQQNFRRYTLEVDFSELSHQIGIGNFSGVLIKEDRRAQRACYDFLQKAKVASHIKAFQARRADAGGFPPDYVDLFYLYAYIRSERPKRVLEYGSGVSTLVMALALEQNGEGRLVSVEPSEDWANSTRSALPEPLLKRAEVMHSRGVPCEIDGERSACFADQPLVDPDMIYVDGAPDGARFEGVENVVLLEKYFGEERVAIFIDGRRRAVHYFITPPREARYEITCYAVDILDVHSGFTLAGGFGFDQFSNTMVRWRGTSPGMSADG